MLFEGSAAPEQQERLESTAGENPTPPAEIVSLMANDDYEATRSWDIDEDMKTDLMALVVLDDILIETINEILRVNDEEVDSCLWLADAYDTIPDYDSGDPGPKGTPHQIDSEWRSPFVGFSVEDVAAFIRDTPRPPKPLSRRYFAVLRKEQHEQHKQVLIYRILPSGESEDGTIELQSVPCPSYLACDFFTSWIQKNKSIGRWNRAVEEQGLYYGHGAIWPNDAESTDVYALIVLDDIPAEFINKFFADTIKMNYDIFLWLADTYDSLPDYQPNDRQFSTEGMYPVDASWRSPFAGKSLEYTANFIRNTLKPPKPLCKTFFAMMEKELYEKSGELLVCKILPKGGGLDQDWNEEHGDESFRQHGRSLMCKITSDRSWKAGEDPGEPVDEGKFEVQWIKYDAGEVDTFFRAFERCDWWEFG